VLLLPLAFLCFALDLAKPPPLLCASVCSPLFCCASPALGCALSMWHSASQPLISSPDVITSSVNY
jgi:hypothetical protein